MLESAAEPSGDTDSVRSYTFRGEDGDNDSQASDGENGSQTLSTCSHTSRSKSSNDIRETAKMLQKDKWVVTIRIVAVIVILLGAIAVSCVEYLGLRESEQLEFEHRYDDQAKQVGHSLQSELGVKLRAMDSLSVTISSYSMHQSVGWPNISLPEFAFRAATALSNGRGLSIGLQPLVYRENLKEWEAFAMEHQEWRAEGLEFQSIFPEALEIIDDGEEGKLSHGYSHSLFDGQFDSSNIQEISEFVFRVEDGEPIKVEGDLMMPVWQYSPIDAGLPYVNYDQYSKERNHDALTEVVEKEVAVLSPYFDLADSFYG